MKHRRAAKVDANQSEIVKELREKGYSVEVGHDDILVGYKGFTFWYEIKAHARSVIKPSQILLLAEWHGHYKIVWTARMIINDIDNKLATTP